MQSSNRQLQTIGRGFLWEFPVLTTYKTNFSLDFIRIRQTVKTGPLMVHQIINRSPSSSSCRVCFRSGLWETCLLYFRGVPTTSTSTATSASKDHTKGGVQGHAVFCSITGNSWVKLRKLMQLFVFLSCVRVLRSEVCRLSKREEIDAIQPQ